MARKDGKDRGIVEHPLGSGMWWVDLRHEGKRIRRKVGSKSAARQVYERLKTEAREGRLVPRVQKKTVPTLKQILDARIEGFTGRDLVNEKRYAAWWTDLWGGKRVDELCQDDFRKLQNRLSSEGEWSPKTINNAFASLRSALNQAVQSGKIDRSPLAGVKLFKIPGGRLRYLTEGEELRLKEVMLPANFRLVRFAILSGLRREEQFTLAWKHVDFRNGILTIPRSKNGDSRHVQLSDEAMEILKAIRSETRVISEWCFPSENPLTPLDPQNFYNRVYVPALKKAGLEDVVWHTLRHTFCSRLVMAGVDIRTVQELAGHKTLAMTLRYSHLSGEHIRESVNRIGKKKEEISEATDTKTDKRQISKRG